MDPSQNDSFGSFSNGQGGSMQAGGYVGGSNNTGMNGQQIISPMPVSTGGPVTLNNGDSGRKSRKWVVVLIVVLFLAVVAAGVFAVWKSMPNNKDANDDNANISLAEIYYNGSDDEWRTFYDDEIISSGMPDILKMLNIYRKLEKGGLIELTKEYNNGSLGSFLNVQFDSSDLAASAYIGDYVSKMDNLIRQVDETMEIYYDAGCNGVLLEDYSDCQLSVDETARINEGLLKISMLYDEVEYVISSAINYYERDYEENE